ncbi:hypothetical protein J421_3182 [Gemmatirosa kalamazoonensis]|uniref:Uncharacterized protein n=1 Tax=Gemmatirosa kalamazoonensis TaxID=861299 RepID=W0RI12_9BACT|nr:hypothetical protein [Gemmatirosa kalamazoonensis]AHG90719.1 hypothetical protein J421_3182 [Gemmatirosa kalamazoonensis]
MARDLAAVDVRYTPPSGTPTVGSPNEPAGPATFGAFDEIVDDEVEEPVFEDDISAETEGLYEEEPEHGERSQQAGGSRGRSGRASARGEETTRNEPRESNATGTASDDDTNALLGAALIGAAIGAGLGLLASRAFEGDAMSVVMRSARKRVKRGVRSGRKAASAAGSAAGEALGDARDAVGHFAERARDSFESALQREVRQLRKAARRRRRRLAFWR